MITSKVDTQVADGEVVIPKDKKSDLQLQVKAEKEQDRSKEGVLFWGEAQGVLGRYKDVIGKDNRIHLYVVEKADDKNGIKALVVFGGTTADGKAGFAPSMLNPPSPKEVVPFALLGLDSGIGNQHKGEKIEVVVHLNGATPEEAKKIFDKVDPGFRNLGKIQLQKWDNYPKPAH